jgi:DsbC/DsbD-like thiol-disulfide interchange protein
MYKNLFFLLILTLLITACNQTNSESAKVEESAKTSSTTESTERIRPKDIVRLAVGTAQLKINGSTELPVKLYIKEGYHVNANPPTHSFLKATELEVKPPKEIKHINFGQVVYPSPLVKKFEFDEEPLKVYEHETIIKLPLQATKEAKAGEYTLPIELRFQACDDKACLPPDRLETSIKVKID